jgi:hypothetical protein
LNGRAAIVSPSLADRPIRLGADAPEITRAMRTTRCLDRD